LLLSIHDYHQRGWNFFSRSITVFPLSRHNNSQATGEGEVMSAHEQEIRDPGEVHDFSQ
jgi:hypothetical protein